VFSDISLHLLITMEAECKIWKHDLNGGTSFNFL